MARSPQVGAVRRFWNCRISWPSIAGAACWSPRSTASGYKFFRKTIMGNSRAILLIAAVSALAWSQTPGPGDPNRAADDVDRAHRPMFQPPPDKAKLASEITSDVRNAEERTARQRKIS